MRTQAPGPVGVEGFAVHPVDRSADRDVRFALHLTI
jgi:hypothetical protein